MSYKVDKFRINWIETSKDRNGGPDLVITSITGFDFQIEDWKKDYSKKYPNKIFETKVLNSIDNSDGTKTLTISRLDKPREEVFSNVKGKNSRLQVF